jgi:alkyl sulfatase BDS1-like metallo-beta-lactamase superfamily hydrolase
MARPFRPALLVLAVAGIACEPAAPPPAPGADAAGHSAPTARTAAANAAAGRELALDDPTDFANARRGLVASDPEVEVRGAAGQRVWSTSDYAFVEGQPPPSVHPSLWRQARLNGIHGLFEVTEGVYQVRGYDLSNMTLIEGRTGWIVVDPLTSVETARAALALARRHLAEKGDRPVSAVIFTHSHIDHFGGVDAVLPEDEAARAALRIVAPRDFMHEATSENVIAGVGMARRAAYMYGMPLARSPRGHVDTGLGKEPARGRISLAAPTDLVDRTPQPMEIDGVRFVFQHVPHSEAPAELTFYLPDAKAFCGAEIVSHTMHNLYTLRGAKVRDALLWSAYIDEALRLFGEAEVAFASHHWPTWGNAEVVAYLKRQRDTYKYVHDQTLRLANDGATPREIAEQLELPASLRPSFANRGYYGTVRHNAKAVYQWYFGWYDGNPAHLDPLPPVEAGTRYVEAMGGTDAVLQKAEDAFARGELRWAATLLDHLVFAEPERREARALLARVYDQLGYRAESGPWRDVYLTGAWELRHGAFEGGVDLAAAIGLMRRVPLARFFESMATRIVGPDAEGRDTVVNFVFTDLDETYVLHLENAVLHHRRGEADPEADATVRLTQDFFLRLALRQLGLREAIFSDDLDVEGSRLELLRFFSLVEAPDPDFPIVTP